MSTAYGIAAVTYVLRNMLDKRISISAGSLANVSVTSKPPDQIKPETESSQLNIFMYYASSNQGWKNVQLASVNDAGERNSFPPLGLDLHYILTAYGTEEFHPDILLGCGMQLLHEMPVLSRKLIREYLAGASITGIAGAKLDEQVEQIKITPETLSIEDISKLWAAFGTRYRPTAAYKVTVVLIETSRQTSPSLPVVDRNIYVLPFREPVIEKILSRSAANQPAIEGQKIFSGYILVLSGKKLENTPVKVKIGNVMKTQGSAGFTASDTAISFILDNEIRAGIHAASVIHPLLMGSPPAEHEGVSSNLVTFELSPEIEVRLVGGNIEIKVNPAYHDSQRVILLLNKISSGNPDDTHSYQFQIPPVSPPAMHDMILFPVNGIKAGTYLVRLQVDGSESPLKQDAAGNYNSPSITIS